MAPPEPDDPDDSTDVSSMETESCSGDNVEVGYTRWFWGGLEVFWVIWRWVDLCLLWDWYPPSKEFQRGFWCVLTRNSHIPNLRLAYTRFQGDLQNMYIYIYMLFCLLGMRSKVHFNTLQYIPSSSFVPPKKRSHKSSCFSSNKSDEGICTKATMGIRDKQFDF